MSRGFSLADARPAFAETQEQLTALGQSQESQSFVNTIGSAFSLSTLSDAQQLNSPVAMLIRQAQRDMFDRDPNYKLTEDRLIQLTQDVDPVYWDMFEEADSEDRANMIRSQALDLTATRRRLGEQGFGGVVASIGTSIADPLALAAGYLTAGMSYGGVAAEAGVVGARAARLTRLARAGAINATPQMVIDAYTASQSPDFNAGDVVAGAAGAFTFGGYLAARGFADFQAVQAGRKMANGWRVAGEGALAQALPTTIVDAIANERTTTETLGAFFLNMAVGGTFATTARTSELGRAVEDYSKKALRDIDQRALFEEGMTATYTPPAPSKEVQDALAGAMPDVPRKGGLPTVSQPTAAERTIRESILTDQITTGESPSIAPRPIERIGQANLRDDYQMGDLSLHQVDETPDENLAVKFAPFANVQQNGTPLEVFVAKAIRFDPSGDNASGGSAATWAEMRAKGVVNEWHSQYDREFRAYNENARKSGTPEVSAQAFDAMVHQAMLLAIDNPAALRTNVGEGPSGWVQDGTPVQLEGVQGPRVRQQGAPIGTIDEQPAFRYDSRPQDRGVIASNEVRRAAKLVFDLNKRTGEVMNRHGIDNPVNTKENYFPIIWDANKIKTAMLQQNGERKLQQVFATAYERLMDRAGLETLFPVLEVQERLAARAEIARLVADRVILNGGTRNDIDVATQHSLLTAEQYNTIESVIRDKMPNVDPKKVREVLFALKPMDQEGAAASFLQSRIPLDYTYRVKFEDGTSMAVGDFLSDSVTDITRHYTRRAYGAAATAELGRVLQETYGLPAAPKTADAILSLVRQQQKATGNEDAGRLLDLEFLLKITNGIPLERPTLFGAGENATLYQSSLRAFRASIRTALLGTVNAAIGQAQEFAGVIGQNGVTAFSRSMPWAWDLRKKLLAGEKLPPGLMRLAVEHGFASGVFGDRVVSGHILEDNQLAANGASRKQRVARVLDKASAYMNRFSGLTSGESFIRNIQEAGVVYSTAESLARVAAGEKSMNIADAELARWGVTRSEYDHILGQLKKYGKDTDAGYHEPNVDKWQDALGQPDISGMAAYERLIDNASRIALQMGETTLLPKSWHTTEGKVFTQLMPYAYSSFYYRLLPLMTNKPNMRSAQMFFASLLSGALGVLALTYMQSINRDDREEFLKERLDPKRFTLMTFGRSSFSSLLPRFVDAAFAASGEAPPFAGSRLSGLGQDSGALGVLAGFPAIDRLKSIIGATRGVVRAPLDSEYDFSQRDVRNAIRALGLPAYPGVHQMIMQLGDLPERPN